MCLELDVRVYLAKILRFYVDLLLLRGVEGRAVRSLERVARIGVNESSGPSIYHIASYSETNEECNTDKGTRCT